MNRGWFCQRVSVQADIGRTDVSLRSGGRSQNERADALASPGVAQARQRHKL
jgi:hypothetical protein